jgi:hypothetical protein
MRLCCFWFRRLLQEGDKAMLFLAKANSFRKEIRPCCLRPTPSGRR